jgi:predicted nucleotidyltransferase
MSIEYNPNNNDNNDEINNINNKISPVVKLFLKRVEQNVPNVSIRLFGSVTNFTHFKDKSDVDCCIIYPDEYTRIKLCEFIEEDSVEFNKTRIKFREIKYSQPGYKDEFIGLYYICFDDKYKIDIVLVNGERGIGPLQHYQHDVGVGYSLLLYIIKWLYYEASVISKDLFIYLKKFVFYFRNIAMTIVHSNHRDILGEPKVPP